MVVILGVYGCNVRGLYLQVEQAEGGVDRVQKRADCEGPVVHEQGVTKVQRGNRMLQKCSGGKGCYKSAVGEGGGRVLLVDDGDNGKAHELV